MSGGDGIGQEMAAKRFCRDGGSSRPASSSRLIGEAERALNNTWIFLKCLYFPIRFTGRI